MPKFHPKMIQASRVKNQQTAAKCTRNLQLYIVLFSETDAGSRQTQSFVYKNKLFTKKNKNTCLDYTKPRETRMIVQKFL